MIRQLLTSVALSLAIVLPAWIVWRIVTLRRHAPTGRHVPLSGELLRLVMIAYLTCLLALTVLPLPVTGLAPVSPNLVPFRTILQCIAQTLNAPDDLLTHCTADFVGNLALMFPFGLLAPLFSSEPKLARRTLTSALIISAGIEIIQFLETLVGGNRSPDIDDVILNVLGAGAGYLVYRGLRTLRTARTK